VFKGLKSDVNNGQFSGVLPVFLFDCGRQCGERVLQMTIILRRFLN